MAECERARKGQEARHKVAKMERKLFRICVIPRRRQWVTRNGWVHNQDILIFTANRDSFLGMLWDELVDMDKRMSLSLSFFLVTLICGAKYLKRVFWDKMIGHYAHVPACVITVYCGQSRLLFVFK